MNKEDCNDRDALIASDVADDPDFAKQLVERALNTVLEAEITEVLGVEKGECGNDRRGYRSGHYTRQLNMKVGTIELRVLRDRDDRFSTKVFERYLRSETALGSIFAEKYLSGTSTRKVAKLAEGLCSHAFSHTIISNMVAELEHAAGVRHSANNIPWRWLRRRTSRSRVRRRIGGNSLVRACRR